MNKIKIPTGYIIVDEYTNGKLETLSIGDYGKRNNIKADFLGFHDDVEKVNNGQIEPLSEKWVVTMSTQYGCPMECKFCDCPEIGFEGNASVIDLMKQLYNALKSFPGERYAGRLNIHFARMGEPAFNYAAIHNFSHWMQYNREFIKSITGVSVDVIHPVLTTMMPKGADMRGILTRWSEVIKNNVYHGMAGLQLSINSTNEDQRNDMFSGMAMSLEEIAKIGRTLPTPLGRKYCLNFALADSYEVDANKLADMFDPTSFMVKITPIHNNTACRDNDIKTSNGYENSKWYQKAEHELKEAGFDVLIFVPSMDEEDGLVTCGNAVLSGSQPTV